MSSATKITSFSKCGGTAILWEVDNRFYYTLLTGPFASAYVSKWFDNMKKALKAAKKALCLA